MKRVYSVLVTLVGLVLLMSLAACGGSTASANPTLPVNTATVSVNGQTKVILTDSRGYALYYYTPDTKTTTACSGSCASAWPPLLATNNPTSIASIPGALTVQKTDNGSQVEYNGHLLYTYDADTAPGQVNGDNVNSWFVATPTLH